MFAPRYELWVVRGTGYLNTEQGEAPEVSRCWDETAKSPGAGICPRSLPLTCCEILSSLTNLHLCPQSKMNKPLLIATEGDVEGIQLYTRGNMIHQVEGVRQQGWRVNQVSY